MNQIKTKPRNVYDGTNFEEVEHIVQEDDPDTSLCGVDQTDVPWNQGFTPCMACLEIMRGGMN